MLRVLYRLRTLSEQAPFDAATFSFALFLLARVARQGGVGASGEGEQGEDEALEQVALTLDVIKFHRSECRLCLTSRVVRCAHAHASFRYRLSPPDDARTRVTCGEDTIAAEQGRIVAPHRSGRGYPGECNAGRGEGVDRGNAPPRNTRTQFVSPSSPGAWPCRRVAPPPPKDSVADQTMVSLG